MALADEDDVSPAVGAVLVEDVLPGPDAGGTHGLELGVLPFADDDLVGEAFVIAPPVAVAGIADALELARQLFVVHQSESEVLQEVRAVFVAEVVTLHVAIGRQGSDQLRRDAPKSTAGCVDLYTVVREHCLSRSGFPAESVAPPSMLRPSTAG